MAVNTYYISQNTKLSTNFSSNEFKCKCGKCTKVEISTELVNNLQKFFEYGITKIIINSAYRCEAHNTAVGGAKYSQHRLGQAADIVCYTGAAKDRVVHTKYICCLADMIGFNGIARISDNATHVDVRASGIYRGDEYPATGGPDYSNNIPNNNFYTYFGITKEAVLNVFPLSSTTTPTPPASQTTTSNGTVNIEQNTGVSGQFVLTTTSLQIEELTETAVKVKASVTEDFKKYTWSSCLAPIRSTDKKSQKVVISSKQQSLTFEDLLPNMTYSLELVAKSSSDEYKSPTLIFKTLAGFPSAVTSLKCDMRIENSLPESVCNISFTPPASWGAYNGTKGYLVSLFINSNMTNSIFVESISKSFRLKDFLKNTKVAYGDTLQVGVQPSIKTADNVLLYDTASITCSKPIYIKPLLTKLDNIYIRINNAFKPVILHKLF